MFKKLLTIFGLAAAVAGILVSSACSSGSVNAQSGSYPEFVVTPTVTNDTVTIPVSVINSKHNVHFELATTKGNTIFEAYTFNNAIQVRASYCVPCRGTTFTLSGDKLICDTCGTVFSAKDGTGISGVAACKSYPKAGVAFTTSGGNIVMQAADLQTTFANTLTPGLP